MPSMQHNLSGSDYRNVVKIMGQVADCQDFDAFSATTLNNSLEYIGAQSGVFFLYNPARKTISWTDGLSRNLPSEFHKKYINSYNEQDPVINYLKAGEFSLHNPVVRLEDVIDYSKLVDSQYYQEFLCRGSIHHIMVLMLRTQNNQIGLAGLHRSKEEQAFSRKDVERAQMLTQLLSSLLDRLLTHEKLEQADKILGILENEIQNQAMLVFDSHFAPLYVSPLAQEFLGRTIETLDNCIHIPDELVSTWHRSAQIMNKEQRKSMPVKTACKDMQVNARIERRNLSPKQAYWVIKLPDAEAHSTAGDACAGLTGRQQQVANLVSAGLSNKEISHSLNISVKTVENHLHSIYEHLNVSNRTMLAHVLNQRNTSS